MPDDRIYDAINLFKFSTIGQGQARLGGDAAYAQRYARLAEDLVSKLWELWARDEIAFHEFERNLIGDSLANRPGADIRVSSRIEPAADPTTYALPEEQGKLAACSGNLVHEATHLVRHFGSYPEEEVLCRTIQQLYFGELVRGRDYRSRVTQNRESARYLPTTPFYGNYQSRRNRLLSGDLIDSVFSIETYRRDLEGGDTAAFVARSLDWWGGLNNRWASTRGYYLRSLSGPHGHDYGEQVLRILESISQAEWPAAKSCAGPSSRIRVALSGGRRNGQFHQRARAAQERLGEDFGIAAQQPAARSRPRPRGPSPTSISTH